jgi:hypothetical protein
MTCKWVSSGILHASGITAFLAELEPGAAGQTHTVNIEQHETITHRKPTLLWRRTDTIGKQALAADYMTWAQAVKANSKQHAALAHITNAPKTVLI